MKSMGKTSRGAGFRGVLNYVLDHDEGKVIGGNMSGGDARSLSTEFAAVRQMRPETKKPVWHQSLRLPAGENLTDEKWREIGDLYMRKMGFDEDHPFAIVKHNKKDGEHIHIVASRISMTGKLYAGVNENLLSTKVTSEIEKELNLAITDGPIIDARTGLPSIKTDRKKVKRGEVEKALKIGAQPARLVIQNRIDAALLIPQVRSLDRLEEHLKTYDITVSRFIKDGEIKGLTFHHENSKFSGSQLGDDYKYPKIAEKLIENQRLNHDQNRASKTPADTIGAARTAGFPAPGGSANQAFKTTSYRPQNGLTASKKGSGQKNKPAILTPPTTLNNQLYNRGNNGIYDIFYTNDTAKKAAFRWDAHAQKLTVLCEPPTQKDIEMLFLIAKNQGLEQPLEITGSDDFQMDVAEYAIKNNITVTPTSEAVKREMPRLQRARAAEIAAAVKSEKDKAAAADANTLILQQKHDAEQREKALKMCGEDDQKTQQGAHFKQ